MTATGRKKTIKIMKKYKFSVSAFFFAVIFWFFDSSIHYFTYKEPQFELIPDDFNEFWMRLVIILLIILFGIYTDYSSRKLLIEQKKLEASRIYESMIGATHHVLNNHLQQMQYFKIKALKSKGFDQETLDRFDKAISDTSDLIQKLSQVENITEDNIWASVDPNNTKTLSNNTGPDDA